MTYSDDILKAYLEGRLAADKAAALEDAAADDPDLQDRLAELDPVAGPVRAAFEHLPDADDLPKLGTVTAQPRHVGRMGVLAAAVAGLLGFALAFFVTRPDPIGWQEQVALYQALYVAETVAPLDASDAALEEQFSRANEALGTDLRPADFKALPGLTLKRAQILSFEDIPLVQIAFAGADGTPFAFCILKNADAGPLTQVELAGLATAHWARGGYGYMLVGGQHSEDLQPALDRLSRLF